MDAKHDIFILKPLSNSIDMVHDLFFLLIIMWMDIAGNNGGHKSTETSKDGQIILPLLIEVPQIPRNWKKQQITLVQNRWLERVPMVGCTIQS